ncbi:hypothetical protein OAB63_02275 [Alphaproteobacteria bacterium]|nr:hypothetical protein [Alphaproteobacteria bacterium]
MELENLTNYSNFIKTNRSLIVSLNDSDYSKISITKYFNKNIQNYFDPKSKNYENFQKLKDEVIILIFISNFKRINDHISSSRLWSLLMRKYLSKIFHHYLSLENTNYRKNFFILSLGKLGVSDLNYSSDIDLIIFFKANSNITFQKFNKIIKNILSKISNVSISFFHKIDMRLRPDFGADSIISDIDSSIEYYSSIGRNWERLAFHRSSFLCGNYSLFLNFKSSINNFLYRKSLDFYAIDEIKKLFSFSKSIQSSIDIKSSLGYIRTCENILHFFQLIWSGKIENLRNLSIHKLFNRLQNYPNIISSEDLLAIKYAYYYYRRIENILHIKYNSKINTVSFEDLKLLKLNENVEIELSNYSQKVIKIYDKLFKPENLEFTYDIVNFNSNSTSIINNWHQRSNEKINSNQIKKDFDNIINAFLSTVNSLDNKNNLVIKFDYLLTYYKSGIHLAALYKYNPLILDKLIFIFANSVKLTNQINNYNFLVESLIFISTNHLTNFKSKIYENDDFNLNLKNSINNFYEELFLLDFHYLSNEFSLKKYEYQRSRKIRAFLFNLFLLVKNLYLKSNKLNATEIIPVLFGSTALYQNLSYSDTDIFFIKMDINIDHMHAIKIIKRFYLIINQYLDKNVIDVDHRNKPFGNQSDLIINYNDFLDFYKSNDDDFYKLSFFKCDIITNDIYLKRRFIKDKFNIINSFKKINLSYLHKIIDIKSKSIDLKGIISIYDLLFNFDKINNLKFSVYENDLGYLKKVLNNQDLFGVKSELDLNFYINKINI